MSDLFSTYTSILEPVRAAAGDQPVYLVGGAVRDAMLGRPVHDLDFVVPANAGKLARRVADEMQLPFYMLDKERDTARVVHPDLVLDFSIYRAADLESDLRARDFTINAMAVDLRAARALIDPLGGARDLRQGQIRACAATSFQDDPVRVLRAVRQALGFQFRILPETAAAMRAAAPLLGRVSGERQRDELFRMLEGPRVSAALRLLLRFDALAGLLPELAGLPEPARELSFATINELEELLAVLAGDYQPDKAANFSRSAVVMRLGRYRQQFKAHFSAGLNPLRPARALLMLAAATGGTFAADQSVKALLERLDHRGRSLFLSALEIERLQTILRYAPALRRLTAVGPAVSRRDIYRFFKTAGEAGVDIILLSLAGTLAEYGAELQIEAWESQLDVCRALLEAWWDAPEERVRPPRLLSGGEVMKRFQLTSGPLVGDLLGALEEAQAAGEVSDREGALRFIQIRLDGTKNE